MVDIDKAIDITQVLRRRRFAPSQPPVSCVAFGVQALAGRRRLTSLRSWDLLGLQVKPATRVALRNDSYALHYILPSKVDPLVSLMKARGRPGRHPPASPWPRLCRFLAASSHTASSLFRSRMCRILRMTWSAVLISS